MAQSRTENKIADHMMIDKWIIKWEDKRVSISVHAKIIWKNYISPTATLVKSKWLRFYQSRFERVCCIFLYNVHNLFVHQICMKYLSGEI